MHGTPYDIAAVDNLIPYARFLERRAWRLKIDFDRHRFEQDSIDIQPRVALALSAESCFIVDLGKEPVMPNTNPRLELTCPVCPRKLRYVTTRNVDGYVHQKSDTFRTVADVHVYECVSHGRFHMGPNGRLSPGS